MKPLAIAGLVWMDGRMVHPEEATVGITDPSVQAGIGVFETVAVREGLPLDLPEHLARLRHGAGQLEVPLPDDATLAGAVRAVSGQVREAYAWVKITAIRTGRAVVYGGPMDPAEEGRAVSAILLRWRQNHADAITGLKTWNYASHILGLEEARRRGADEGIWRNSRGHLAEGCTSTLFLVEHRKIFTPALADGILPGITRKVVLDAARAQGCTIHEGKVRLKRLESADEAFLTSSLRAVRPLVTFDGKPVGKGVPGALTLALAKEVARVRLERAREREELAKATGPSGG